MVLAAPAASRATGSYEDLQSTRLQCHRLLRKGQGEAKESVEEGRKRECVSQQHVWEQAVSSPKPSVGLSNCVWGRKGQERESAVSYWKKQVSLGVVRAVKTLSTNLLVLEAAYLWIWPQSWFLRTCFWKMWQWFNLKCGLWRALCDLSQSKLSSSSTQGPSGDIRTILVPAYRLSLVHGRSWGIMSQIGMESLRKKV